MNIPYNNGIYRHKTSKKYYRVINGNMMIKIDGKWTKHMVLYTPLYLNEDGYHFVRSNEDFNKHFEHI